MPINSYLAQLMELADEHGVDLLEACIAAGVADSTFYRWRSGSSEPTLETALKVQTAILRMAGLPTRPLPAAEQTNDRAA
jgi:DNA-binding phage protein